MTTGSEAVRRQAAIIETIDEARSTRKRGSSRGSNETQPPVYQVMTDVKSPETRVPVLTFAGDSPGTDLIYIELPVDQKKQAVRAFSDPVSTEPIFTLPPRSGSPIVHRDLVDSRGETVGRLTTNRRSSLFRTRWTVSRTDGTTFLVFREPLSDAIWRRTMRPFGSLRDASGPDFSVLIINALFYPIFAIKPRCRMEICGPDGREHGTIQFVCTLKRPREDFSIYLPGGRTAESDTILFPAALAAVQSMR